MSSYPEAQVTIHLFERAGAAQLHCPLQFVVENGDRARGACLQACERPEQCGPPYEHGFRAEGPGLDDVAATANSAVHPDLCPARHCLCYDRKRIDGRNRPIKLTPSMI